MLEWYKSENNREKARKILYYEAIRYIIYSGITCKSITCKSITCKSIIIRRMKKHGVVMNENQLIQKDFKTSDQYIQKVCLFFIFFILINWLLNIVDIYDMDDYMMNVILIVTVVLMGIPLTLFRVWDKPHIVRYITAFIITLEIGMLYSIATIHTILLFTFPMVLFSIYASKWMSRFIVITTVVVMFVAHVASYYFTIIPEEPFTKMDEIITFGYLPRLVQFLFFAVIIQYVLKRNKRLIDSIINYSDQMYVAQEELVRQFAEISESKSGQTGSHVKRVERYMAVMVSNLELSDEERHSVVIASMLHDVGKLLIPPEIIEKPGRLTEEEFAVIKTHTLLGHQLLERSPGQVMEIAAKIALEHHERWDGKGYQGIKGEEIDYYSRIMAVVDVFDALISKRSYKEKWPLKDAYDEIVNNSGTQFDPGVVELFKKCYPQMLAISKELPDE